MPTNDAPAADRLAAICDEMLKWAKQHSRNDFGAGFHQAVVELRGRMTSVLAASGEPPREPSETAIRAAFDVIMRSTSQDEDEAILDVANALRAAYAAEAAAPRAPHAPDLEAARAIAANYEKAPCFSALLGELDPDSPCTCPTCGHRAILLALGAASGGAPQP